MSKNCLCPVGTTHGSYLNQRKVVLPDWGNNEPLGLDECIADEILQLWQYGIKTVGHCCGHHITSPYIQPKDREDATEMVGRGYIVILLRNGQFCAKPKSIDWDLIDWIREN